MLAFAADWANLLIRWGHMIAGIGWIGTSFYFIALDLSLKKRENMKDGVMGTAWEVHGGGFYHVEKFTVAPKAVVTMHWRGLPSPLHIGITSGTRAGLSDAATGAVTLMAGWTPEVGPPGPAQHFLWVRAAAGVDSPSG